MARMPRGSPRRLLRPRAEQFQDRDGVPRVAPVRDRRGGRPMHDGAPPRAHCDAVGSEERGWPPRARAHLVRCARIVRRPRAVYRVACVVRRPPWSRAVHLRSAVTHPPSSHPPTHYIPSWHDVLTPHTSIVHRVSSSASPAPDASSVSASSLSAPPSSSSFSPPPSCSQWTFHRVSDVG